MKDKITVSYTFNDTNYHGAYKEHLKHRNRIWIYMRSVLCFLMVIFGSYLMILSGEQSQGSWNIVFGPIFVTAGSVGFLRPMIWQMWHERNVRKNPNYGSKLKYVFSEQGVDILGNKGDFKLLWEDLFECVKRPKGILLYLDKKRFLWVPARAFKEDTWSHIDRLLPLRGIS